MSLVCIDTNVLLYAAADHERYGTACQAILDLAARRKLRVVAGLEVLQEFLHTGARLLNSRQEAADRLEALLPIFEEVIYGDRDHLRRATKTFCKHLQLGMRDAAVVATAKDANSRVIVSADRDFDGIKDLTRIDPLDSAAISELISA